MRTAIEAHTQWSVNNRTSPEMLGTPYSTTWLHQYHGRRLIRSQPLAGLGRLQSYQYLPFWPMGETDQRRLRDWRSASLCRKRRCLLFLPCHVSSGLSYVSCSMLRLNLLTNVTCGKRVFKISICCIRYPLHFGKALKTWAASSVAVLRRMANNSVTANSIIRCHRKF